MTQLAPIASAPHGATSETAPGAEARRRSGAEVLVDLPGLRVTRCPRERGAVLSLDPAAPAALKEAVERCMWVRNRVGGFAGLVVFRADPEPHQYAIHTRLAGHVGQVLERNWDLARRLEVFVRVARSVQGLHEVEECVKALSPQHVLLNTGAAPMLLGPGIVVAGTEAYQAPESLAEGRFDERSDLYCLGALLSYLLTGEAPAVASVDAAPRAHAAVASRGLRRIVRKACAPRAEDRYGSVYALLADLARHEAADDVGLPHARDEHVERSGTLRLGSLDRGVELVDAAE